MDKPLRVIYVVHFELEGGASIALALNRHGQATHLRGRERKHGMPHPPKRSTIDLRPGDKVFYRDGWRTVLAIHCLRDVWFSEVEARQLTGDDGYIYRPRPPK